MPGAILVRSPRSRTERSASISEENALTETGTVWALSSRRVAVTTISSMVRMFWLAPSCAQPGIVAAMPRAKRPEENLRVLFSMGSVLVDILIRCSVFPVNLPGIRWISYRCFIFFERWVRRPVHGGLQPETVVVVHRRELYWVCRLGGGGGRYTSASCGARGGRGRS